MAAAGAPDVFGEPEDGARGEKEMRHWFSLASNTDKCIHPAFLLPNGLWFLADADLHRKFWSQLLVVENYFPYILFIWWQDVRR